jgi:hypothetical protein
MYWKIYGSAGGSLRGTHYIPGTEHVFCVQASAPTGVIRRVRISPLEVVAQGSMGNLKCAPATQVSLDPGSPDIEWLVINGAPALQGRNGTRLYRYPSAPSGGLGRVDPSSLPLLPYAPASATLPEDGQGDSFYAARISASNYAIFRFYKDPESPTTTRIDWITYKLSATPDTVGSGYPDPRDILITEDSRYAYVTGVDPADGKGHVYKVPNAAGPLAVPSFIMTSPAAYALNQGPLADPQQLALYNGKVYVVDATSLFCIEPDGATRQVASGLGGGRGLVIDELHDRAYLTNQAGQIFVVAPLSTTPTLMPLPPALSPLPGPSGFLTWADAARSAFYVPLLAPAHQVLRVDLIDQRRTTLLSAAPADPWSVEVLSPQKLILSSALEIGGMDLSPSSAALLVGIGYVSFDYIVQAAGSPDVGKADTTTAPSYFYQVKRVPFGGDLDVLIDHDAAFRRGARYYRLTLQNLVSCASRAIIEPFADLKWLSSGGLSKLYPVTTSTTGASPAPPAPASAFPVRGPTEVWYTPRRGAIIETSSVDDGLNKLTVEFFDAGGVLMPGAAEAKLVLIDNGICHGDLEIPRIGAPPPASYPTPDCGCLRYASKGDRVEIDFTAWHPRGHGQYTLTTYRGGALLPALTESGPVETIATLHTKSTTTIAGSATLKVGHILGECALASVMIDLDVSARVIDGYRWLSKGSLARRYFTLVPDTTQMSTPWVDPGQ